jgi:anti-sigma factor ChrR (cupin superfamily)
MSKPSDKSRPAAGVLDAVVVQRMAAAIAPAELAQADRDAMHGRILRRIAEQAPAGTTTLRASQMQWVCAGPGVEVKVLRMDRVRNDQTMLVRMQPGATVVAHRHTQQEECLVLEGEIFIGNHRLSEGDMHVAQAGVMHAPIRAPHGALLLIRSEIPPRGLRIA